MHSKLSKIKDAILAIIRSGDVKWQNARIIIDFPPFTNRGITISQIVKDSQGNNVRLIRPTEQLQRTVYEFIVTHNQSDSYNQIVFTADYQTLDSAEIVVHFNDQVNNDFQQSLPKSKRGKTIPWWKDPEQTKEYGVYLQSGPQEPAESFALTSLKKHLAQLPVQEPPIADGQLNGKPLPELYKLVDTYLRESTNPLWDGGLISLKKDDMGEFTGKLVQYYYESEEDRQTGSPGYEEAPLPVVTERMKSIYNAIRSATKSRYPDVAWDTVIISIYNDGSAEATFEWDDDEVEME